MTDHDPKENAENTTGESDGTPSPHGKKQAPVSDIRDEVNQNLENIFGNLDDEDESDGIVSGPETPPAEKTPETVSDGNRKIDLTRADAVGKLDGEEEAVVDWIDDPQEPPKTATETTRKTVPDIQNKADAVRKDIPENRGDDNEGDDADGVTGTPEPDRTATPKSIDAPSPVAKTAEQPTPAVEPVTPADPPALKGKTEKGNVAPQRSAKKKPAPAVRAHPPTKSAPAEQEPRKPHTSRIIVWGIVLIIITLTVRYFASYGSEELVTAPAETGQLFHKIAPVPTPVVGKITAKQPEPTPPVVAKAPDQKTKPAKPAKRVQAYKARMYPYAIHTASFQSLETAREESANYRRGFQAYLVRSDLGKKGVWYRLFMGHFPNATAALDAIKKYHLSGALVGRTRYACLVGSYPTAAQADATARQLIGKGFLPYAIAIDTSYHLFVGAHPSRAAAEALLMDLSKNGFPCDLIER